MSARRLACWAISILALSSCASDRDAQKKPPFGEFEVSVELENEVYRYLPAPNEAGPLWSYGNSMIARIGDRVFAGGEEPIRNATGYNSIRWRLYELSGDAWSLAYADGLATREPSPLAVLGGDRLVVSANPSLDPGIPKWGPSQPILYLFQPNRMGSPSTLAPEWAGTPVFNHHSYRSLAVDHAGDGMILFHHDDRARLLWAYFRGTGQAGAGSVPWLHDETYETPQDVRVCYPAVQIRGKSIRFLGVSDIVEPNSEWRAYKGMITGSELDYDFRRLFYLFSDDIETGKFSEWIEISSRETTAGYIAPCDIHDDGGLVHILWYEKAIDERLKQAFFPEAEQSFALEYAVLDGKKVIRRQSVMVTDGSTPYSPQSGRFHATPDGRLFVIYSCSIWYPSGSMIGMRVAEVSPDGAISASREVVMEKAPWRFFTATARTGNAPSFTADLYGEVEGAMRYARLRIE